MENHAKYNHISKNRISQLREVLKNTKQEDIDQMVSDVGDSTRAILLAANPQINKKNKLQKIQLRNFLNSFISWMTMEELIDVTNRIEYYEKLYEKCSSDVKDDFIALEDTSLQPLNKRIERLLIHGSLLPNTKNKNDFYKEMESLMSRLSSRIENDAKKMWFSLTYLEAGAILDTIRVFWIDTYDLSIGEEINSYLSSINFTVSLNDLFKAEVLNNEWSVHKEYLNDCLKYEIQCNKFWEEWVNKQELLYHFKLKWYKIDWDYVSIYQNDHIEIKAYLNDINFENHYNESVTLEIYAQRKKDKIKSTQFLALWMWKLSFTVEKIINDIYSTFWAPKQRYVFDLEALFDKMEEWESNDWDEWAGIQCENTSNNTSSRKEKIKSKNKKIVCSDIILEDKIMKELEILIGQFTNEQHYIDHWVSIPKWIVLYWPPWTWKTLFAKHISNKIDAEFITINSTELLSKWSWINEKNLKKVFTNAKISANNGKKIILFFDEADGLFEKRDEIKTHKEWMITVILEEMDWINEDSLKNIFVFFTTNRVKAIDSAIISRFDKKIEIWLPSIENIIKLFKLNIWEKNKISKHELFEDELDYELLAKKTKWKSWRFIKILINNTVLSFAHSRVKNPKSPLITTQDIINGIKLVEDDEKSKIKIWF